MADPPANPLTDLQDVVRSRLRALRIANGWSLDELAERTRLGASTLSRIETGHRTIGLDVLPLLCAALHTDLAALLDVSAHDDVVIRPVPNEEPGRITWPLTRSDSSGNVVAAKWRLEPGDRRTGPAGASGPRLVLRAERCGPSRPGRSHDHRRRRRGRRVLDDDPALDRGPRANDRAHHDLRSHGSRRARAATRPLIAADSPRPAVPSGRQGR